MEKIMKIEMIEDFMTQNKLSKTKFCKICKISVSTLNKILNNQTNVGIVALFKICRVMKIQICNLFY